MTAAYDPHHDWALDDTVTVHVPGQTAALLRSLLGEYTTAQQATYTGADLPTHQYNELIFTERVVAARIVGVADALLGQVK